MTSVSRQNTTMSDTKSSSRTSQNEQGYDTKLVYSHAIALKATYRKVDVRSLFSHELAPFPMSLFENSGEMRLCTSKSDLKSKTQVAVSVRTTDNMDCVVLDECAVLWVVQWP